MFIGCNVGSSHRCCHEHIEESLLVVFKRTYDGAQGGIARFGSGLSHLHLHLVVKCCKKVHPSVTSSFGTVDDGEVGLQVHGLAVISRHLGRAIYDGSTEFQHGWVGKSLEYDFITDAVCISVRYGNAYFFIFHKI